MDRITGLPERTLVRRFQQAISGALGYEDPRFFVRLFKREVKLTPAQYRRKFGQLRVVLQAARQD